MSESKAAEQQQSPQERDAQIVADAMQDHGKHYWCLVRALKRKKKGWWDLANLIGEGSTVAKAIWGKYDVELPPNYPAAGAPAQQGVTTSRKDEIAHVMMEKFHEHLQDCVGGCPYCHQIVHEYEAEVRALAAPPVSEGLTIESKYKFTEIINHWLKGESFVPMTYEQLAAFAYDILGQPCAPCPDCPTKRECLAENKCRSRVDAKPFTQTGQTLESLLDHLCNSEDKTFCQRGRAELREILGQQFSPREPDTQAGPRCPKCGKSGTLEFHGSEVFAAYVECHDDDCDFDLAANEVGELAQFFPSPEQGWVKEVARLAFGRGGPIADWYCWCEICCLLRRVLPAPPRPSTEEGK